MSERHIRKRLREKLRSAAGFTLTETLMAVLIMSIIFTAVGGGVVVMQRNYRTVTLRAQAQTLLATTISAINTELESATEVTTDTNGNVVCFYSMHRNTMVALGNTAGSGTAPSDGIALAKWNIAENKAMSESSPLASDGTRGKREAKLYTQFPSSGGLAWVSTSDGGYFTYTVEVKAANISDFSETQTVKIRPISDVTVTAAKTTTE